jgi:simple sugar transport system ATP-binding protein
VEVLLEMKNITKAYGSVLANDGVNLMLNKGEILAVVGENGAGKSTIMKILYGLETPTSGEIYLNGELQRFKNPQDAIKNGIGMVQQHFMLFNPFTVAENIVYGNEPKKSRIFFDRKKAVEIV